MKKVDFILQSHNFNKQQLIGIMQDVQKEYHYLPQDILCYIAKKTQYKRS